MHTEESLPLKPTRAGFIRSLPVSMPIEEVIERGREIGLAINPSDVHSTRYYMRQEAAQGAPKVEAVATQQKDADVATMVRRNYQLLESQRASESTTETGRKAPAPVQRHGKKAPARVSAALTSAAPAGKKRKSASIIEGDTASLEDVLRRIVTRIGSDRARAIIEELETSSRRR